MVYFLRFSPYLVIVFMFIVGFGVLKSSHVIAQAVVFETTSVVDAINPAVSAYQRIGKLRKQDPIDADALTEEYTGTLQDLTQQVDVRFNLSLDSDVLAAIDEIRHDNEPKLAAQVIDKTLQGVFFLTILDRITSVRDNFEVTSTVGLSELWEEAAAAFEAIIGTAARDNKILTDDRQSIKAGSNPGLDIQITQSLERGRVALNKGNFVEDKITVGIEREIIRLSLVRAYYIGVLREVEGIISNRDREIEEAREKQKEGEIFYRIVESFVARDNPVGNVLIKAQLTGNLSDVTADEIVSEMSAGFIGRVKGELSVNELSVGSDRERAMVVAEEALLYSNIFLPDLELRLGTAVQNDLLSALNNLKNASRDGDISSAVNERQVITEILANYQDALKAAKYNKTNETDFIDAAVLSFQDIGILRKQNPIDANAIDAAYAGELQQLSQLADQVFSLTLDNDIKTAISDIKNDINPKLAAQVIDKTLQRLFALVVYNRITLVRDAFDNMSTDALKLEWDRAYAAFQAIIGTTARENKVLTSDRLDIKTGINPNLDSMITAAFIRGQNALNQINADDKANLAIDREIILISMIRSFFIGVLREVDGIIDHRDREVEEALEKQKEGEIFYRIIDAFVATDNPIGNNIIKTQLTGSLHNVNADRIVSEISKGIIGRISVNLNINEKVIENDKFQAKITATKISHYTGIFIDDLELRLNALKRIQLENALQDLIHASDRNNLAKAIKARQTISTIIAEYTNHLI